MNIKPVASKAHIATINPTNTAEIKARAVAAFTGQAEQPIVGNQNAVQAEELGAIRQPQPKRIDTQELNAQGTDVTPENTDVSPERTEKDPALSRQFAQLARQERQLRDQARDLKRRQAELEAKEQELSRQPKAEPDYSGYISKDRLKSDPLAVMAETGLSYDELTQQILTQQPRDPRTEATISRLEAKIAALEKQTTDSQKSFEERDQKVYNDTIKQYKIAAKKLVFTDPEFETIKATNSVNDVVELIEKTFQETGEVMELEDAAREVEEYLVEEYDKLSRIDKLKKRIQANAQPGGSAQKLQPPQKQPQQMKTLTNAVSTSPKLGWRERAIAAAEGRLKS